MGTAVARGGPGDLLPEFLDPGDPGLAPGDQDVAHPHAPLRRRAAGDDAVHEDPLLALRPERFREVRGERLDRHAEPPAAHGAVGGELLLHRLDRVDGDGEAEPLAGAHHGRVDPDHLPAGIQERAAGIARVDRGVGLDELVAPLQVRLRAAPGRAHHAEGDGALEPEGVPDRDGELPHLEGRRNRRASRRAASSSAGSGARRRRCGRPRRSPSPGIRVRSDRRTTISSASRMTCSFVTISPSSPTMTPEPREFSRKPPFSSSRSIRYSGGCPPGHRPPAAPLANRVTVRMLTTAGTARSAAATNACWTAATSGAAGAFP